MSVETEDHPTSTPGDDTKTHRSDVFEYVFPAIRGIQAQRHFYVTMFPLRLVPRLFLFDEEELQPTLRAQRSLNKARIPEIARYMLDNPSGYVFSALTASVDADIRFDALGKGGAEARIGQLAIPMSARFVINDGQHRRAAIEQALRENPDMGDESIPIVLFLDIGLERSQQMFADLNRYAIRPARSLTILYDQRENGAQIVKSMIKASPLWSDLVELERSNLSARSRKLFTLSALHGSTKALLESVGDLTVDEAAKLARTYWDAVAEKIPEWRMVYERKVTAGDVRRDFVHSHGIALHALGKVGNTLLRQSRDSRRWRKALAPLTGMDWSRSNASLWEGRAILGGRVSKTGNNVILTTNALKKALGLELTADESHVESLHERGRA
ncbi:DNA sulfur modification protein DndB [Actinokineospora spheciospongiae]|uniref:DNA sulfur modification protein DndB n=1 Tax=Actinokineospora spheciospongiae TaxID=909613 RepID=UPI000D717915|nr:DNA sulfur modification protein DndB [Actinokineospora spheciospongiae]PWW65621.1 DNA sulfur modification protein DndB [Actinokineospora spheciospongiae]